MGTICSIIKWGPNLANPKGLKLDSNKTLKKILKKANFFQTNNPNNDSHNLLIS